MSSRVEFADCPVGSPTQPCAECKAGWDKVSAETKKIDSMKDVRARNRAISASYAKLYQGAPELKWAGAAAFASKQVGCGMDHFGSSISGAKSSLGAGNLAVYDELYPALRFYQISKGKMTRAQIEACLDQKPGSPLDKAIRTGLDQTMDGDAEQGALTMLKHEQQDTLQQSVYDSWLFRRNMDVDKASGYRLAPLKFAVTADCDSSDSGRVVDFSKYSGDLYNFDARWPFARDCAKKFVELSEDPKTRDSVNQELNKIANSTP